MRCQWDIFIYLFIYYLIVHTVQHKAKHKIKHKKKTETDIHMKDRGEKTALSLGTDTIYSSGNLSHQYQLKNLDGSVV